MHEPANGDEDVAVASNPVDDFETTGVRSRVVLPSRRKLALPLPQPEDPAATRSRRETPPTSTVDDQNRVSGWASPNIILATAGFALALLVALVGAVVFIAKAWADVAAREARVVAKLDEIDRRTLQSAPSPATREPPQATASVPSAVSVIVAPVITINVPGAPASSAAGAPPRVELRPFAPRKARCGRTTSFGDKATCATSYGLSDVGSVASSE